MKNDCPKISIIIPVYNVEKDDFKRGIKSLLSQTLKELEFIFVDDCGTKNAINIAYEYQKIDNRIKIIHNEKNSGSGVSRNHGMKMATGKYLAFFDADDTVDVDFYEKLYAASNNGDYEIVKAGRKHYLNNGTVNISLLNENISKGLKNNSTLYCCFTYEHQSAIYKADFIRLNNATYGNTYVAQDTTFLLKATYSCKKF